MYRPCSTSPAIQERINFLNQTAWDDTSVGLLALVFFQRSVLFVPEVSTRGEQVHPAKPLLVIQAITPMA